MPLRQFGRMDRLEQQPDCAGAHGLRPSGKRAAADAVRQLSSLQRLARLRIKKRVVHAEQRAGPEDGLCDGGVFLPQKRDHALAQPVAPGVRQEIGAVGHIRKSVLSKTRLDLRPRADQHRPDEPSALRRNAGQSGKAGPAREVQEHGLEIVVLRVCRGDKAGECVKERVAELARSLFQRFMRLRRPRLHVAAARVQRHAERGAQLPDKGLVAVGFRAAQVMVEVRGLYPDAERVLQ